MAQDSKLSARRFSKYLLPTGLEGEPEFREKILRQQSFFGGVRFTGHDLNTTQKCASMDGIERDLE